MLQTPVYEASAPLILGAEGMSFPLEEIRFLPTEDILVEDQTQNTTANLNSAFNTPTLNTPEIQDFTFDGNFEEFFTWNEQGNEALALETVEPQNEPITTEFDFCQPETIWGFKTFDEDNFEICAPPAVVEGNVEPIIDEQNLISKVTIETVDEKNAESTFHIEDNDVLKWIIDDQRIDDLPILENSQTEETPHTTQGLQTLETTEILIQELTLPVNVEVKTEDLGEDEKYRKMRIQNNEASRKCRLNRKRKHQDMEEEYKLLEERNVFLKTRLEEMEQEVKVWKKKLLSDIASTSSAKQSTF